MIFVSSLPNSLVAAFFLLNLSSKRPLVSYMRLNQIFRDESNHPARSDGNVGKRFWIRAANRSAVFAFRAHEAAESLRGSASEGIATRGLRRACDVLKWRPERPSRVQGKPWRLPSLTPGLLEIVDRQVRGLKFGSVQITVNEGRVVQIESSAKIRFDRT